MKKKLKSHSPSNAAACSIFDGKALFENCGPQEIASGLKLCENKWCMHPADTIIADATAIWYVCSNCVDLVPDGKVIKSNAQAIHGRDNAPKTL